MRTVTIYTDGACSGNPGPGGWGAILSYKGAEKALSGGAALPFETEELEFIMPEFTSVQALKALGII